MRVMGILNTTPDSFSDGGRYEAVDAAVARGLEMAGQGAELVDVGGESTRPGAEEVDTGEEIRRTVPVVERLAEAGVAVSIDTRKAVVAKAALDAGAWLVNDTSGGTFDPAMLPMVADRRAPVVLMHMRGTPQTMDSLADYDDVVSEVCSELGDRVRAAKHAGVAEEEIMLDPGLGFAKTPEQSIELLRRIDELATLGLPLVVGPSRKRFVGHVLDTVVGERLEGTLAVVAWCAVHGVATVRVHDVLEARRVVDMIGAIRG